MTPQHHLPADIERTSMGIITEELAARGLAIPPENAAVVKRVIHTTADFDYAENLRFTPGAAAAGVAAMRDGAVVITDTNMALAGITKPGLAGRQAGRRLAAGRRRQRSWHHGRGRAVPLRGAGRGQRPHGPAGHYRGNRNGLRPALALVPAGFVNVVESKERPHAGSTVSRPLWLGPSATWRRPQCGAQADEIAAADKKQQGLRPALGHRRAFRLCWAATW